MIFGYSCPSVANDGVVKLQELTNMIQEVESQIIPYVIWAVEHGAHRIILFPNNADVGELILRYMSYFITKG